MQVYLSGYDVISIRSELDATAHALDAGDLATARRRLASIPPSVDRPADEAVRLDLLRAHVARREGALGDAASHVDAALRRLNASIPLGLVMGARHLQADLLLGRGAYERARTLLRAGLSEPRLTAEDGGVSVEWRATFLRSLGAVETRLGRPAAGATAYRDALALFPEVDKGTPSNLEASLHANLAMALHMSGDDVGARRAASRARELRASPGTPLRDRANTAALWALLHDGPDAEPLWSDAVALASISGDVTLDVEIRLRAALNLVLSGRQDLARGLGDPGRSEALRLARQEPTLVGLARELEGEWYSASGDTVGARRELIAARAWFTEIAAAYHVARLDAALAALEHAHGTRPAFLARLQLAVDAANRGGFRLPKRFDRLFSEVEAPTSAIARYVRRTGLEPWRLTSGVTIHVATGVVEAFGQRHSLGRTSVTFQTLEAIVVAGSKGIAPARLARRLWPQIAEPAALSRLRFQMHRLRTLFGRTDETILCLRGGRRADSRYVWNAAIAVSIASRRATPPSEPEKGA